MGAKRQLGRFRRKERRVENAARELFGVDPFATPPPGFHFDVCVSLRVDASHRHYGVYTTVTGRWPDLEFTTWYDCAVCGHISGVE